MCPLGGTARESRIRDASAYLRELALRTGPEPDPEPDQSRLLDPPQIHPRSTPGPDADQDPNADPDSTHSW